MINNFKKIEVESPVDKIINQIRNLISSGKIKPGEKLPSERQLSELFGVGRTYVRDAIKKLEFFGILKALPQSGTVVAGTDITVLQGIFSQILKISNYDFFFLVETWLALEKEAVRLAAIRRTSNCIEALWDAYYAYQIEVKNNKPGIQEDFLFHLKIAEVSQNQVIRSLIHIILPEILNMYQSKNLYKNEKCLLSLDEHAEIIRSIEKQNIEAAMYAVEKHLYDIYEFTRKNKVNIKV